MYGCGKMATPIKNGNILEQKKKKVCAEYRWKENNTKKKKIE